MMKKNKYRITALISIIMCFLINTFDFTHAIVPDVIIYEGRLMSKQGAPIITPHYFRFSLWSDDDFVPSDLDINGQINTAASNYGDWQEIQLVTPNSSGIFTVELGKINPLPNINHAQHKYLQVEIKKTTEDYLAFQLMDPTGDNGADDHDRKTIGSMAYAFVAEKAETSDQEIFIIDADDTIFNSGTGSISLQFGNTLNKILSFDLDNDYFNFNWHVNIEGDLTVEENMKVIGGLQIGQNVVIEGTLTVNGLINGKDINDIHKPNTDIGTDATSFEINNQDNGIILDSTGLSDSRIVTFDDANTKVVGEDNNQTLTNKNIDGEFNTITNIDRISLKDQDNTLIVTPEHNSLTVYQDGTNNMASINKGFDNLFNQAYYMLSSKQDTIQDLDININIAIPNDYQNWQNNALQIYIKSSSENVTDNYINISMQDSNGDDVALSGELNLLGDTSDIWILKNINIIGDPIFTPGSNATIRLKMHAKNDHKIYFGQIKVNYIGK